MYQTYLITGATGFLGRAVLQLLLAHSCRILALVMDKDPLAYTIPENVTVFCGDLTDKYTLRSFFAAGGDHNTTGCKQDCKIICMSFFHDHNTLLYVLISQFVSE